MCQKSPERRNVGDTLKAIVTPANADATYQWYADDEAIEGATKAVYTVKAADKGAKLSVEVTVGDETVASAKTSPVGLDVALSEVKLDNELPKVGDVLTAYAYDADGNDISDQVTWQWYRSNAATGVQNPISNATKQTYTITTMDAQGTVYVWATDANDNTLKSNEAAVVKQKNVSVIYIDGIGAKQTYSSRNDVAVVGDTLEVQLDPVSAAKDVEYKWYRNNSFITGATDSKYEVTKEDAGLVLECRVTIPTTAAYAFDLDYDTNVIGAGTGITDGAGAGAAGGMGPCKHFTAEFAVMATEDISDAEIKLSNGAPSVGQKITATVPFDKNGDGKIEGDSDVLVIDTDGNENYAGDGDEVKLVWYRGTIAPANKIAEGNSYTTSKIDLGKAIWCEATAIDASPYSGKIQASTDAIKIEVNTVTIDATELTTASAYGGKGIIGTTLSLTVKDKATKDIDAANLDITWTLGTGTTAKEYKGGKSLTLNMDKANALLGQAGALAAAKSTKNVISVTVNGKGDYTGSVDAKGAGTDDIAIGADPSKVANIQKMTVKRSSDSGVVGDTTSTTLAAATKTVAPGEKLTISTVPSAAADDFVWTWGLGDTSGVVTQSGSSFTIPAGTSAGNFVKLAGVYKAAAGRAFNWMEDAAGTAIADSTQANVVKNSAGAAFAIFNENGATDNMVLVTADTNATPAAGEVTMKSEYDAANSWITTEYGLTSVTLSYNNGKASSDSKYKAYETPEVGSYLVVEANVNASNTVTLSFDDGADFTLGDPAYAERTADPSVFVYKLGEKCLGHKIKVEVKAADGSGYSDTYKVSATTPAVVPSSRTIANFKVLNYVNGARPTTGSKTDTWYYNNANEHDDATIYAGLNNVKSLDASNGASIYTIVALDSNGDIFSGAGVEFVLLDRMNQIAHVSDTGAANIGVTLDTAGAELNGLRAGQTVTIKLVPDQINYVGEDIEYSFTSEVS